MNKNNINFCKDCRYFKISWLDRFLLGLNYGICKHPRAFLGINPVTGKLHTPSHFFADGHRKWNCQGNDFEPRKPRNDSN